MKGRYIVGLIVLVLGVGLFVERLGYTDIFDVVFDAVFTWWPLVLIAYGIHELTQNPRKITGPLVYVGLGVVFLANNVFDTDLWTFVLPTALIIIGLSMLVRSPKRSTSEWSATFASGTAEDATEDMGAKKYRNARYVSDQTPAFESTLSEGTFVVTSPSYVSGRATVLLGSMTVDFRQAGLANNNAVLMVECTLGSADIIVPVDWNVSVVGSLVLGSIHSRGAVMPAPAADRPRLTIDVSGALSEVTVRYA
ncbi:MAG: LiaF transmembrane domain-containing protein [Candidatus Kapaibacterium sp.]